ncbi:MATE family efflux transporter [Dinoroseobacter sp. PD6]|uniref:MATE family efflux transporter n=1 Tax=Dinoroseobacter sp. PD6 TaxID=3028384 RepID=UPI00237B5AE5|nr:MATE family efflux transporter [Dinoroseobacter sp. PD6]MDD9718986.1 MATE family efflux transporter [Dinoroseobacter sp. PD6]
MSSRDTDMTQGSVGGLLWRVSAPMSLGILGVLMVGLADAFFLARVGEVELAAVGFVYPVIVAVSAFSIGMSAGANTVLSQAIGRTESGNSLACRALHAVGFGALIGLGAGSALWLVAPVLFTALGAKGEVHAAILAYLPWWAASFPILVVTMILNAAFRAGGDGLTPSALMVATAVVNIAMTSLLVFGIGTIEGLGMAGAGIATLAARMLVGVLALGIAIRRGTIAFGAHTARGFTRSVRDIAAIGLPAAASRAVNPAGMALVTAAAATLGDAAVAGFGAAARVQALCLVPFFALSTGLAPIIGQAWGADMQGRARHALRLSVGFALGYGLCAAIVLWILADPIAQLMTDDGTAASYTAQYLTIVGWSLGGYGLVVTVNAALTARSKPGWALGLSLTRIGVIYVPLAWLGALTLGFTGILLAAVAANVIAAWLGTVFAQANSLLALRALPIRAPSDRLAHLRRNRHARG